MAKKVLSKKVLYVTKNQALVVTYISLCHKNSFISLVGIPVPFGVTMSKSNIQENTKYCHTGIMKSGTHVKRPRTWICGTLFYAT